MALYIDFHLKELTADDRFSVRTKLLTDLDAALKNTVCTENYFKLHSAEFNQEDKDYVSCFKITDKFHPEYKTVEDLEAEDEKLNVMKKIIADELKERKAAPTNAMKKYITKRIDQIDKLHERLQVDELDDEPHSPHYMSALSGFFFLAIAAVRVPLLPLDLFLFSRLFRTRLQEWRSLPLALQHKWFKSQMLKTLRVTSSAPMLKELLAGR